MHLDSWRRSLAAAFDRLASPSRQVQLEHWIVKISAAGFVIHLALVFLARTLPDPPAIIAAVGKKYLAAIYTPFSFILFYEVLMLIAALPQSTTQSIAKQFEIVSLIFIRRFFKDIAEFNNIAELTQLSSRTILVFVDVAAGLLMFFLVTVFLHAARRRSLSPTQSEHSTELKKFIDRKKAIALGLTVLLLSLAVYSLVIFGKEVYAMAYLGEKVRLDPNTFFYTDVFAVMIFTDVLILILSLVVSDSYELVFRNAAFVISTILIRFSLTVERPFAAVMAVAGMVFGILTLLVYNYHSAIGEARWAKERSRDTS